MHGVVTRRERSRGIVIPKILAAQALSSVGTSVSAVALAVMVFDLTGSVLHMGAILAASAVPIVVMSVMGGVLLDRYDGRNLMVVSDLLRGGLILVLPFLAGLSIVWIYLGAATIGAMSALFNPSQVELLAQHTEPESRVRTNSMLSIARDGAELGGYLLGGVLVASLGYFVTFSLDAATYALSAMLLLTVPRTRARACAGVGAAGRLLREVPAVVQTIWRDPALRVNMLVSCFPMAALMMVTPNAYALALQVFKTGPKGLAWMETFTAIGLLLGGLVAGRRDYRGDLNVYVLESLALMSAMYFLVALAPGFWWAAVLLALGAVANVGVVVGSITLFQSVDATPERGRIIAIRSGSGQLGNLLGLVLGGLVGSMLGVRPAFFLMATAGLALTALVYIPYLLGKRNRTLSARAQEGRA